MKLACWFRQCRWVHVCNINHDDDCCHFGIYQCSRCKTISMGSPRAMLQNPRVKTDEDFLNECLDGALKDRDYFSDLADEQAKEIKRLREAK